MGYKMGIKYKVSSIRYLRGLSLVEFLVASAVLGLMATLVASIYLAHFRLFSNQSTQIDVTSQNKIALDEMTNQIRESESVVTTCANCGGDTTGANVIVLRLWPLDANGEPIDPNSGYDYIVYRQDATDNTKLVKKIIPDDQSSRAASEKVVSTSISSLTFTYNDADVTLASEVTISLTTSAKSINKTQTATETSKAQLRNK